MLIQINDYFSMPLKLSLDTPGVTVLCDDFLLSWGKIAVTSIASFMIFLFQNKAGAVV